MDKTTKNHFENLQSDDKASRTASFESLAALGEQPVNWAYEVWDGLVAMLRDKNNDKRAMAGQLLSILAKSDTQNRMVRTIDKLIDATYDEKFLTARRTLQSFWKIAIVKPEFLRITLLRLSERFKKAMETKNGTLIRYDIIVVFRRIYDILHDGAVKYQAVELIGMEEAPKYQKKYAAVWKDLVKIK